MSSRAVGQLDLPLVPAETHNDDRFLLIREDSPAMDSHAEVIEAASRDAAPPSASSAAPLVPAPPRVYPASAASAPSAAEYGPGPALLAALQASKLGLEATCPYDGAARCVSVGFNNQPRHSMRFTH